MKFFNTRNFKKIGAIVATVGAAYAGSQALPYSGLVGGIITLIGTAVAAHTDTIKKPTTAPKSKKKK